VYEVHVPQMGKGAIMVKKMGARGLMAHPWGNKKTEKSGKKTPERNEETLVCEKNVRT